LIAQAPKEKDDAVKRINRDAEVDESEDPSEAVAREKDKIYVRFVIVDPPSP
jgi:hypothetical protein